MNKKGRISDMFSSLVKIAKINKVLKIKEIENFNEEELIKYKLKLDSFDFDNFYYFLKKRKNLKKNKKNNFYKFFRKFQVFSLLFNRRYILLVIAFIVEYLSQSVLYNGTNVAVGSLGFSKIQYNGMLLGLTSSLGSIIPVPYVPQLPRKTTSQLILVLMIFGGLLLGYISKYKKDLENLELIEAILSAGWINVLIWSLFTISYLHMVESFPIKVRGLAAGVIIFVAKVLGAGSAILTDFSQQLGFNSLVLCCVMPFVALPFTLFFKETLQEAKLEKKSWRGTEQIEKSFSEGNFTFPSIRE